MPDITKVTENVLNKKKVGDIGREKGRVGEDRELREIPGIEEGWNRQKKHWRNLILKGQLQVKKTSVQEVLGRILTNIPLTGQSKKIVEKMVENYKLNRLSLQTISKQYGPLI
jgi:hypothetical protein